MKRKRRTTLLSTSVRIFLSLSVQAKKESGEQGLLTIPLLSLSALWLWWWMAAARLDYLCWQLDDLLVRFYLAIEHGREAAGHALALLGIGARSVLYGLGLAG